MAVAANKRSVMTMFSGVADIYSHQVRIVLAEKGVRVVYFPYTQGTSSTLINETLNTLRLK